MKSLVKFNPRKIMRTLPELEALSNDTLRIMLGKLAGWTFRYPGKCTEWAGTNSWTKGWGWSPLPNYPEDLNACHEVERSQGWLATELDRSTHKRFDKYITAIRHLRGIDGREWCADSRQRTISLIFVLQKEEKTTNPINNDYSI